jgi:thiamine pyrophosphokinase
VAFMKAIVVGNGRVPPRQALPSRLFEGVALVIAADGGAERAASLGLRPDLVVGDMDSLAPEALRRLESVGTAIERVPAEKDESDLELAIRAALARGATTIVILGALGGPRIEHELANIALLGLAGRSAGIAIVDERCSIQLLDAGDPSAGGEAAAAYVHGEPGDYVSLQPWGGDAGGVTTQGLRYPLQDEPLLQGPSRGLSNELAGREGHVSCRRGRVLVIHTRRSALDAESIQPRAAGNERAVTSEVG